MPATPFHIHQNTFAALLGRSGIQLVKQLTVQGGLRFHLCHHLPYTIVLYLTECLLIESMGRTLHGRVKKVHVTNLHLSCTIRFGLHPVHGMLRIDKTIFLSCYIGQIGTSQIIFQMGYHVIDSMLLVKIQSLKPLEFTLHILHLKESI